MSENNQELEKLRAGMRVIEIFIINPRKEEIGGVFLRDLHRTVRPYLLEKDTPASQELEQVIQRIIELERAIEKSKDSSQSQSYQQELIPFIERALALLKQLYQPLFSPHEPEKPKDSVVQHKDLVVPHIELSPCPPDAIDFPNRRVEFPLAVLSETERTLTVGDHHFTQLDNIHRDERGLPPGRELFAGGAYTRIFHARDERDGRKVAIKIEAQRTVESVRADMSSQSDDEVAYSPPEAVALMQFQDASVITPRLPGLVAYGRLADGKLVTVLEYISELHINPTAPFYFLYLNLPHSDWVRAKIEAGHTLSEAGYKRWRQTQKREPVQQPEITNMLENTGEQKAEMQRTADNLKTMVLLALRDICEMLIELRAAHVYNGDMKMGQLLLHPETAREELTPQNLEKNWRAVFIDWNTVRVPSPSHSQPHEVWDSLSCQWLMTFMGQLKKIKDDRNFPPDHSRTKRYSLMDDVLHMLLKLQGTISQGAKRVSSKKEGHCGDIGRYTNNLLSEGHWAIDHETKNKVQTVLAEANQIMRSLGLYSQIRNPFEQQSPLCLLRP